MKTENRLKAIVVDQITGVVLQEKESSEIKITTKEEKKKIKEQIENNKKIEQFKQMQKEICGNFVFFIFQNIDNLTKILNDNDLVKFVYLSTYLKSNSYLMLDNNITYINKTSLRKLLKMNYQQYNKFWDKLIENELIKIGDDKIKINYKFFFKGYKNDYKEMYGTKLTNYTRIYTRATRELFETTTTRQHKRLSIIYKLLPYVNWKYNILCYNIQETNKEKLNVLTIKDILDILNYDKTNITRFKKDFYSLKFKEFGIFVSVQDDPEYLNSFILVNPLLLFRGHELEDFEYLLTIFHIKLCKTSKISHRD